MPISLFGRALTGGPLPSLLPRTTPAPPSTKKAPEQASKQAPVQANSQLAEIQKLASGSSVFSPAPNQVGRRAAGVGGTGNVTLGPNVDPSTITAHTRKVLSEIMASAKMDSVFITSSYRGPDHQARVMYEDIQNRGVAKAKRLYASAGDQVIDNYSQSKSHGLGKQATIDAMEAKIKQIGPSKVSKHSSNPRVLNVIDIAPSKIPRSQWAAFEAAIKANPQVSRLIPPSKGDAAFHLEIPQP